MPTGFYFRMLGSLELWTDEEKVPIHAPRQRTVLARLLMSPDQVVSVDNLIDAVWGDHPPATGRTQVAICVTALRKIFRAVKYSDDVIVAVPPGYRLCDRSHRIDAVEFGQLVADARTLVGRRDEVAAVEKFTEALDLWRGEALSGVSGQPIREAAQWLEQERLTVLEQRAELQLELGQHRQLVGDLAALVREHPQRETARAQLMLAQYRCGQRADALETFRAGRQYAVEDCGLEPGPLLRELHDAILHDSPGLGEQTGSVTSAVSASGVPAQLPAGVPEFTGRDEEIATLHALTAERDAHGPLPIGLITGALGIGKTAVAVHWARQVRDRFPDGQLFADLHGSDGQKPAEPDTVLARFLTDLGVPAAAIPAECGDRAALYRSITHGRRLLVVLDDARDYAQIAPLLPGSGSCCTLATSVHPIPELLGYHCAISIRIDPLPRPAANELIGRIAGDRRLAEDPVGATRLVELCGRRPLTLRIAAAKLAATPRLRLREVVTRMTYPNLRLDELRHDGDDFRARLAVTYGRLAPLPASLFRTLSLLPDGSLTPTSAASLLDIPVADAEIALEHLVDAHLLEVSADGTRYRLDALTRIFAREQVRRTTLAVFVGSTTELARSHEEAGPRRSQRLPAMSRKTTTRP